MKPLDEIIDENFVLRLSRGEPWAFEGQLEDKDGNVEPLAGRTFFGCVMAADGTRLREAVAEIYTDSTGVFYRGVIDGSMSDALFGQSNLTWWQGERTEAGNKPDAQGSFVIYPGPGMAAPVGPSGVATVATRFVRRASETGRARIRKAQAGARGPSPWDAEGETLEAYNARVAQGAVDVASAQVGDALLDFGEAFNQAQAELDETIEATNGAVSGIVNAAKVATLVALAALTPTLAPAANLVEAGRAGQFTWQAGDNRANVAADPSKAIFVPLASDPTGTTGAWVRATGPDTRLDVRWFGAKGDGVFDNAAAFQAALNYAGKGFYRSVYAPDPAVGYFFSRNVIAPTRAKLFGDSIATTRLFGGNGSGIITLASGEDQTISDLWLETGVDSYGGITTFHTDISRLTIERVKFTDRGFANNGIKLVFDNSVIGLVGCTIRACLFLNNGRMGCEIQNHAAGAARYRDVVFTGNLVSGTGQISAGAGMGVSLSGFGLNCRVVTNIFRGNLGPAVEFIGPSQSEIAFNGFDSIKARPIQCANTTPMNAVKIYGNYPLGDPALGAIYLNALNGAQVFDNEWNLGKNADGSILWGVEIYSPDTIYRRNKLKTFSNAPIAVHNAAGVMVLDNDTDNLAAPRTTAMVYLNGAATMRTVVAGNRFKKAAGGVGANVSDNNGSSGNIMFPNYLDDGAALKLIVEPIATTISAIPRLSTALQLLNTPALLAAGNHVMLDIFHVSSAPGLTLQCEATAGGQPPGRFVIEWGGRADNAPKGGRITITFGSFDNPTTTPNVKQSADGDQATINYLVVNGKRKLQIVLPVTAGSAVVGSMRAMVDTPANLAAFSAAFGAAV